MPTYAILAFDAPDKSGLRAATRPRHLAHLDTIADRIVRAGPFLGDDGAPVGSLILAEFDGAAAARAFADADPYTEAGLFETVRVFAWRQVLPSA